MRRLAGALVVVFLMAALVRAGSETVTIKVKDYPAQGKALEVTEKQRQVTKVKITDPDGRPIPRPDEVKGKEVTYTQKILEVADQRPTKTQRKFTRARVTLGDQTRTAAYEGRTVVFHYEKGKVKATPEGGPALEQAVAAELAEDALKDFEPTKQRLLPKKPVKVGESWPIDGKVIAAMFRLPAAAGEHIKARGKLAKVYKKGGRQWGTLEFRFDIPVPGKGKGKPIPTETTLTVDTPIDGSSTDARLQMKTLAPPVKSVVEDGGKKYDVVATSEISGEREQVEK
jgi:hypothetical protein